MILCDSMFCRIAYSCIVLRYALCCSGVWFYFCISVYFGVLISAVFVELCTAPGLRNTVLLCSIVWFCVP